MKINSTFSFLFVLILAVPVCLQAFPINGLVIANSMTFTTYTVVILGNGGNPWNAYSPDTLTIQSGDTVIWAFGNGTHSSTCGCDAPCGLWDTGVGSSGFSTPVPYTSFAVGTNGYYCEVHGCEAMYGAVIRTAPSPPPTSVPSKYWQKLSSSTNQQDSDTHPLQKFFGLTFVSPGNSTVVKTASSIKQSATDNANIGSSAEIQVNTTH